VLSSHALRTATRGFSVRRCSQVHTVHCESPDCVCLLCYPNRDQGGTLATRSGLVFAALLGWVSGGQFEPDRCTVPASGKV